VRSAHAYAGTSHITERWVSLKDLMFFVDELPNLVDLMEDYETNLHLSIDA